ncbi:hypothetical protein [Enterobacter sp. Bisph1]|uniref:hypothetical protein n=1 Tax=Enterobacter sp. Bisph1 TaxID=1274399 RepID=UPI00057C02E0|nr:hypothetical protein [Enterobacter sp. Bisph1]
MHAGSFRLRFIKRHLLMLMVAFGWLFIQSQMAIAAHGCHLSVQGENVMVQHLDHHMMMDNDAPQMDMMNTPLCEKHCVPDQAPKEGHHPSLVALPVSLTLSMVQPVYLSLSRDAGTLSPPAAGPPATIRFCRFRE